MTRNSVSATIVFALSLAAQAGPESQPSPAPSMADLAWLAGAWAGPHRGGEYEEHWTAPSANAMLGMSRTNAAGSTVFHEFLRITRESDGVINYRAQPKGRCPDTSFALTSVEPGKRAVFHNPKHDFPQTIIYELAADGTLTATIEGSNDGKAMKEIYTMRRMAAP